MNIIPAASSATDFLDLHQSVKFVAGAYIVVLAVILTYVVVMAVRLTRNQRELGDLRRLVEEREDAGGTLADGEPYPADRERSPADGAPYPAAGVEPAASPPERVR